MSNCRMNNWSVEHETVVNQQINIELTAAHIYTALYSYFSSDQHHWPGLACYFKKAAAEEREHADKFIEYQNIRGGTVSIDKLDAPVIDFSNGVDIEHGEEQSVVLKAFTYALELEQNVYDNILKMAKCTDDVGFSDFLDDFVKEQLEGQYELGCFISQLKIIQNNGFGLWQFDQKLLEK